MADPVIPKLIPIKDLHLYGGPKRTTVYKLLGQGELIAKKTPWGTYVTRESFEAYMARQPRYLPEILRDLADVL